MADASRSNEAPQISDWQNYGKYRPAYPQSLERMIMKYHRDHSNSLRLAHDMGSGSGVFVPTLAKYFQHVHVSDISPSAVAQARQRLSGHFAEHWWQARFTFATASAEDACSTVADRSVDMVIMMESAHLMDSDAMVRSVAQQLTPNGTLALVSYTPAFQVLDNERVQQATTELFRAWSEEVVRSSGGVDSLHLQRVFPQNQVGLDFVSLPDDLFYQAITKRITINTHGRGNELFGIPGVENLRAESRVGKEDRLYEYSSVDAEGEGWHQKVDAAWLRGYIASLGQEAKMHLYEEPLNAVEEAIRESCPDAMVEIEWPVAVLFATRR